MSFLINYKVPEDLKAYSKKKKKISLLYLEKQNKIQVFLCYFMGEGVEETHCLCFCLICFLWGVWRWVFCFIIFVVLIKEWGSSSHLTSLGFLVFVSNTMQNCLKKAFSVFLKKQNEKLELFF